jgi:hypothetical protein
MSSETTFDYHYRPEGHSYGDDMTDNQYPYHPFTAYSSYTSKMPMIPKWRWIGAGVATLVSLTPADKRRISELIRSF